MTVSEVTFSDEQWWDLLQQIDQGQCTPFIGPEAFAPYIPPLVRAKEWAAANKYPLEDSHVLAKVAQYLAITNPNKDPLYPKRVLSQELKKVPIPNFASNENETNETSTYKVLADLPFSIYITTNYDKFMEAALEGKNRKYISDFCRWNSKLAQQAELLGLESKLKRSEYMPAKDNALVYHLHGVIDVPQSMVLTEKDYIAFAIELNKEETVMLPPLIRRALATTQLLFIGYSLEDITFRVIFQGISMLLDSNIERPVSFAVQLPPTFDTIEKQKFAQEYLDSYTKDMFKVAVYWKDTKQFIEELRKRWNGYQANIRP